MKKEIRVLLIDDERDFIDALGFFLRSKGYHVSAVRSAKDALKALQSPGADMVFLDFNMPDMDGLELLSQIRKFSNTLPVVLVTGYPADVEIKKAGALGISGIFPKTDRFLKLEAIIEVILRTHPNLKSL